MSVKNKRGHYYNTTVEVMFNGEKKRVSKENAYIFSSKHKPPKGIKVPKGFVPYDKRE